MSFTVSLRGAVVTFAKTALPGPREGGSRRETRDDGLLEVMVGRVGS